MTTTGRVSVVGVTVGSIAFAVTGDWRWMPIALTAAIALAAARRHRVSGTD